MARNEKSRTSFNDLPLEEQDRIRAQQLAQKEQENARKAKAAEWSQKELKKAKEGALSKARISKDGKMAGFFHFCKDSRSNDRVQVQSFQFHQIGQPGEDRFYVSASAVIICNKCEGTGKIYPEGGGIWNPKLQS